MITVNVARDFTRFPAGRFKDKGSTSGQEFRERFLEGPVARGERVSVELDGTIGYGSSFLEEAFGGLVRVLKSSEDEVLGLIELKSEDKSLIEEIRSYIKAASSVVQ